MKIEIEKSEYDRLVSREEKLMAYYYWFVDKENDLATVEDVITENIKLKEENKNLNEKYDGLWKIYTADVNERIEENKTLKDNVEFLHSCLDDRDKSIQYVEEENKKLKEEDEELRAWLRQKLPLALLKEYMEKFEGVDLKNV